MDCWSISASAQYATPTICRCRSPRASSSCCVAFVDRPGRVLSRDQLIEWTRGRGSDAFDRNIDVQMSRLRKKLVESSFPEDGFKTVRNAGYVLTAAVENAS